MTDTAPSSCLSQAEFLSIRFDIDQPAHWRDLLLTHHQSGGSDTGSETGSNAAGSFDYIVTPNVDHVVRLSREADIHPAYTAARWRICDSRILAKLAQRRGLDLKPYPGSDMVADLFQSEAAAGLRIAVLGPSHDSFTTLAAKYPALNLCHIEAPIMQPNTAQWEATLAAVEATPADIYLLCLSFPKQEFFAHALKTRAKTSGLGLCVGASIDFLTGHQQRAPLWMRNAGLEWAHRLLSNPTRLWKRYLIDAPKIFAIYLQDKQR